MTTTGMDRVPTVHISMLVGVPGVGKATFREPSVGEGRGSALTLRLSIRLSTLRHYRREGRGAGGG